MTALTAPGGGILAMAPIVNGLMIMEPVNGASTATASTICGTPPFGCSISFQYWLDLDAAEAAHPGVFIKQPLVIEANIDWSDIRRRPGPPRRLPLPSRCARGCRRSSPPNGPARRAGVTPGPFPFD